MFIHNLKQQLIMTPKEKAWDLISKVNGSELTSETWAKQSCWSVEFIKRIATIMVDEMIMQNGENYLNGLSEDVYRKTNGFLFEVKQEIEKL
jgi:hypothetical protein